MLAKVDRAYQSWLRWAMLAKVAMLLEVCHAG